MMDMFKRSLRILPTQLMICAPRKALIASLIVMNSSFHYGQPQIKSASHKRSHASSPKTGASSVRPFPAQTGA